MADLDTMLARATSAGGSLFGAPRQAGQRSATVTAPEGNPIGFIQAAM